MAHLAQCTPDLSSVVIDAPLASRASAALGWCLADIAIRGFKPDKLPTYATYLVGNDNRDVRGSLGSDRGEAATPALCFHYTWRPSL